MIQERLQPRGIIIDVINDLKEVAPPFIRRALKGDLLYIYKGDPNPAEQSFQPDNFWSVYDYVERNTQVTKSAAGWEFQCLNPSTKYVHKPHIRIVGSGLQPNRDTVLTHGGYGNVNPFLVYDFVLPFLRKNHVNIACIQPFNNEKEMIEAFSTHYNQAFTFALSVRMIEEVVKERNKNNSSDTRKKMVYVGASMGGIAGLFQSLGAKDEPELPDKSIIIAATSDVPKIFRKAPAYVKLVDHQAERAKHTAYEGTYPKSLLEGNLPMELLENHLRAVIFKDDRTVIDQVSYWQDLPDTYKVILNGGHDVVSLLKNLKTIKVFVLEQILH